MLMQVCSFYDSKTLAYSRPFFLTDLKLVDRVVKDVLSAENDISRHPEDFTLFHIGTFDDSSAVMESLSAPVSLARMHEVIK